MVLIPTHSDVFPSKAFVMQGSGFSVAGDQAGCGLACSACDSVVSITVMAS